VRWFRRLAAGLLPRRPLFDPGSVYVGFMMDEVALEYVSPEYFRLPLSISFHRCSITRKRTTIIIIIIIIIIRRRRRRRRRRRLHQKP
jgi:hypothetical protein